MLLRLLLPKPPGGELRTFVPANCLNCFDSWLSCEHNNGTSACFLINPSSRKFIEIPECHFRENLSNYDFPCPLKMIVCSLDLVAGMCEQCTVASYRPGDVSWSICPPDSYRGYVDIAFLHR